jgi:predicted DNA-binding transcriptional regulator YafY
VEDISSKLGMIEQLEEAIATQRRVRFRYKRWYRPDKIKCYEEVEPYKIIIFDGFWYLLTRYKEHTIKFYLREITHLELQEQHFIPDRQLLKRMNRAINIWFDPHAEPFEVTLLLDSDAIPYWERKPIRGQQLIKQPDGTATLTLEITHTEELFAILKKWLPQIRVIEPEGLQEAFEEMLRGYME